MGIFVICSYRPKASAAALDAVLKEHHPVLRSEGLASDFKPLLLRAGDGTILEIFEWNSEAASRAAHDNPRVQEIWARFALVSDFVPARTLSEFERPFAHFAPHAL